MGGRPRDFWYTVAADVVRPTSVLCTRREWSGQRYIPRRGGVVVVTNHISFFDPVSFAHFVDSAGRHPRFLAKSGLFTIPVVGPVLRGAGQIPVYRENRQAGQAYRDACAAVRKGECVVVYPDGTITRDPAQWPMVGKTGAARIALETGCEVIPVAQWGAQRVLPAYTLRFRPIPRKQVVVTAGPPVDLAPYRGQEQTPEVLRKATDAIVGAITGLLATVRGEPAPATRYDPRADRPAAADAAGSRVATGG